MHPLAGDLTVFKDADLETKVQALTRNYFATQNTELRVQISSLIEDYNAELGARRAAQLQKLMAGRDKDLDKLIRVN